MLKKIISLVFIALLTFSYTWPAEAAISEWHKGASFYPNHNSDFNSDNFKQSVQNLKSTGANYVTLIIPYYQSNLYSTDVAPGWNTPTDESLIAGITYVHSLGMKVMLKPHLESYTFEWRANINPGDRDTWYRNYTEMLKRYARIAQSHGVEDFCIGTELISMATYTSNSDNTARWQQMIREVRGLYSGKLTYSANWGSGWFADEKAHIGFWGDLDYIGISAYFPLYGDDSVDSLKRAWDDWNNREIRPLSQTTGKSIVFTEVGYRSVDGARNEPWNYYQGGGLDLAEQANLYTALFSYWNNQSFMKGVDLWDWKTDPNGGGSGDNGYTPQHKPAQEAMRTWFSTSQPPDDPPPPSGTPNFNVTGSASPSNPTVNQNTTISLSVKNNGQSVTGAVTDVEVYDQAGNRALQRVFDNQAFSAGETKNYSLDWTPTQSGQAMVKVGLFNSTWSTLYSWHDNVLGIAVGSGSGGGGGGSSGPVAVDIWWPTNGASVGGTQPFKGAIYDRPLSEYRMYWQVDGDRLNDMFDSQEDYPHKEVLVDLTGWNWKGTGPYLLNFVAKDLSGNTLGEKSASITVGQ